MLATELNGPGAHTRWLCHLQQGPDNTPKATAPGAVTASTDAFLTRTDGLFTRSVRFQIRDKTP